jgi:NitT/TauT family transport system ATP-binding protein
MTIDRRASAPYSGRENAASVPCIVALQGVTKRFASGTTALDRLDLDIRRGEFLTVLGPSGCGKSTALRLIAGLTAPTGGRLAWTSADDEARRSGDIGFVFQDATLMPWASVAANIALPLELEHRPRVEIDAQVDEALDRVGLAAFRAAYPRELSGGMRMRVSIARALVTHPRLLLMDEPFAALDEITRFKLNKDLLTLWAAIGTTVVFVTHSVFESVFLSSRIVVMTPRPGHIAAEVAIEAPYPRNDEFRNSPAYARYCGLVSEALADAMRASP